MYAHNKVLKENVSIVLSCYLIEKCFLAANTLVHIPEIRYSKKKNV
jgi:hypothetical protein